MTFYGRTFRDLMASPFGLVIAIVAGYGGYYVWTEHQAHFVDALPYLFLGGCIVMHLFMHRGHGHSHGNDEPRKGDDHHTPDTR